MYFQPKCWEIEHRRDGDDTCDFCVGVCRFTSFFSCVREFFRSTRRLCSSFAGLYRCGWVSVDVKFLIMEEVSRSILCCTSEDCCVACIVDMLCLLFCAARSVCHVGFFYNRLPSPVTLRICRKGCSGATCTFVCEVLLIGMLPPLVAAGSEILFFACRELACLVCYLFARRGFRGCLSLWGGDGTGIHAPGWLGELARYVGSKGWLAGNGVCVLSRSPCRLFQYLRCMRAHDAQRLKAER